MQLSLPRVYASNGAPQRWVFIQPEDNNGNLIYDSNGSPVYEIYNIAAGLCLTAPNLAAGPQLTMDTCNRTRPVPAETVVNRPNEAAVTSIPPSTGMRGPVFRAAGRTGRPGPAPA